MILKESFIVESVLYSDNNDGDDDESTSPTSEADEDVDGRGDKLNLGGILRKDPVRVSTTSRDI